MGLVSISLSYFFTEQANLIVVTDICAFDVSEKLVVRQANRRSEAFISHPSKKKPAEPFFTDGGKNALIITGGWLVICCCCCCFFINEKSI